MKHFLSIFLAFAIYTVSFAQIDNDNIYIPNSCPGELVIKKVFISKHSFEKGKFYFKGSNVPNLKAFINGVELDTVTELEFNERNKVELDIEFEVPNNLRNAKIFYHVDNGEKISRGYLPIHFATFTLHNTQNYIQTNNACTETVNWALPFYGTQTDIILFDITDGKRKKVASSTFYCCSRGNIIQMPKDTKGTFLIKAQGCWSGESMTFDVNTLSKN